MQNDGHSVSVSEPIFIHGMMERSGTNFFMNLLGLHPACAPGGIIWEDHLLANASLLMEYAKSVYQTYGKHDWKVKERLGTEDVLCKSLGDGLISFLFSQFSEGDTVKKHGVDFDLRTPQEIFSKRLVTKTPNVTNLQNFFKFFPRCPLLILIRDGRAVTESGAIGFKWHYEVAMQTWAGAARTILEFDKSSKATDGRCLIVRYEDLCDHLEDELQRVFDFLGLDPSVYDFEKAGKLPVLGSSVFRGNSKGEVHWDPVNRTTEFKPQLRHAHWNRAKHERFNWLAGKYLTELGYEKDQHANGRYLWFMYNIFLDLLHNPRALIRRLVFNRTDG